VGSVSVALVYVGTPDAADNPVFTPPLGNLLLHAVLSEAGIEAHLFDARLQSHDEITDGVLAAGCEVVGFSFLSPSAPEAEALAARLHGEGRFTVAGGVHATIHAEAMAASDTWDAVVTHEGEGAIVDVARAKPSGVVAGGKVADLDALPPIQPVDCYRPVWARNRSYYVQLGRGCPFRCTFCEVANRDVFAAGHRTRSLSTLTTEIDRAVDAFGAEFLVFIDSIATLDEPLLLGVLDHLNATHPSLGFMFNAHANKFSEAIAEATGRAERASIWFGFENGSQRLLNLMKKATRVERSVEVAELCHRHGVDFGANLLLGLPTETAADYDANRRFIDAVRPRYPNPNILTPLPGTEMYDYCSSQLLLRDPRDVTVWDAERIRAAGTGPVRGVDYCRVLDMYDALRAEETPTYPMRWEPWQVAAPAG
jgi:radical SAM superfamily enzyme YgiQ (UPF0313 family)